MKTTLTIKTDTRLRDAAKRTANKLGIPLTTIVNAKLAEFVREGRFEISLTPKAEQIRVWERMSKEMDAHPERFAGYASTSALFADMDKKRKR